MLNTIHAEAQIAARTGAYHTDNPYPRGSEQYVAWERGFMDGMMYLRTELKVVTRAFERSIVENGILKANLAQLKAEYDAFLMEQGY